MSLYASTFLLRSHLQLSKLLSTVKELANGNVLIYSLSHDCPNLEDSVKQLTSSTKESIGCLSARLPLSSRNPFFSCSVAVFKSNGATPFGSLEAGPPVIQIGRSHSYPSGRLDKNGAEAIDERVFASKEKWSEIWESRDTSRYLPEELRDARSVCLIFFYIRSKSYCFLSDSKAILYFSDNSSSGLSRSLYERFPKALLVRLMSAP
jgi:hypothetical protein